MLGICHQLLAGLPGSWEIWILLLVILLLFGSRIPKVARSLGQGISQFKKGLSEGTQEVFGGGDEEDEPKAKASSAAKKPEKDAPKAAE